MEIVNCLVVLLPSELHDDTWKIQANQQIENLFAQCAISPHDEKSKKK